MKSHQYQYVFDTPEGESPKESNMLPSLVVKHPYDTPGEGGREGGFWYGVTVLPLMQSLYSRGGRNSCFGLCALEKQFGFIIV